jgi:hypothetical protein
MAKIVIISEIQNDICQKMMIKFKFEQDIGGIIK